jgi:oligopeptidase B
MINRFDMTNPKWARAAWCTAVLLVLTLSACKPSEEDIQVSTPIPQPPVAKKVPRTLSIHGEERVDEYYWIRDDDRKDEEVLDLLNRENQYTSQMMAHTESLQGSLFDELTNRLKVDDRTVPVKKQDYQYFREFREGGEYPVYLRKPVDFDRRNEIEVLLDANEMSNGHEYYNLGNWVVSPGQNLIAFAEDIVSRRLYSIRIKDLDGKRVFNEQIPNTSGAMAWGNDDKTLFYVKKNLETLLPYQVYRHTIGQDPGTDELVYEERDLTFATYLYNSRDLGYIVIALKNTLSSEYRLIDADHPEQEPVVFLAREPRHEYSIHPAGRLFYVRSNWKAENFRLLKVDYEDSDDKDKWVEVIPARENVLLEDIEVFQDHLAIQERVRGQVALRVVDTRTDQERSLSFADPVYTASLYTNPELDSSKLRYQYSSMTTPDSVYEYDMDTGGTRLLKQDEVVGGYESSWYKSERIFATARDGVQIPVSIVYRKNLRKHRENPLYVYAYGAYGYSSEPAFSSARLSLLDRGFVYAMVHVRGGEEMGRQWYLDGKMLNKRNTFWDFIDATRFLVAQGYGDKDKVFASGGSAGGLLMGVVANEAPELYKGIIAHVPFVDVVTTMLDESIPLTAGEFDEWGNPRDKQYYDYMLSYSPYDQVSEQHYPHMFVTTGLWDSQVQYFEPVKWVAKLRDMKQDDNRLLIDVNMDAGHGGASGRYKRYRTTALEFAFMLDLLDVKE